MTTKSQPPSDEEPRIPIGTLGEFEMRGLSLSNKLVYKGAGSPTDSITMPASLAVRMVFEPTEVLGCPGERLGICIGCDVRAC